MKLSSAERAAYDEYQEQLRIEASEIEFSIKRAEVAEEALKEERRQKEESLKREAEERRQKEEAFKRIVELEAQRRRRVVR